MVFGWLSPASQSVLTLTGWLRPELETELPVLRRSTLPIKGPGDVGARGKQRWGVSGSCFQDSGAAASCCDGGGDTGWEWAALGLDTAVLQRDLGRKRDRQRRYRPVSHGSYGQSTARALDACSPGDIPATGYTEPELPGRVSPRGPATENSWMILVFIMCFYCCVLPRSFGVHRRASGDNEHTPAPGSETPPGHPASAGGRQRGWQAGLVL